MSTLTTDTLKAAIAHAEEMGNRNGMNAASWVIDGNTTEETCRAILKGIDDGDPMVLDSLPGPEDFLGPILHESLETAGIAYADMTDEAEREILDSYDWMFRSAVENEVASLALGHLMGSDEE